MPIENPSIPDRVELVICCEGISIEGRASDGKGYARACARRARIANFSPRKCSPPLAKNAARRCETYARVRGGRACARFDHGGVGRGHGHDTSPQQSEDHSAIVEMLSSRKLAEPRVRPRVDLTKPRRIRALLLVLRRSDQGEWVVRCGRVFGVRDTGPERCIGVAYRCPNPYREEGST